MAGWGAELAHRAFISDATLDLSLAYRQGTGAFGALNAPEEAFGEGLSRAKIVTYELGLALPFKLADQPLRYNGDIRGQWSHSPLAISTDRFSIGGRYTVRGFDGESVLVSQSGWTFRNDLSVPLGESGQEFYIGMMQPGLRPEDLPTCSLANILPARCLGCVAASKTSPTTSSSASRSVQTRRLCYRQHHGRLQSLRQFLSRS